MNDEPENSQNILDFQKIINIPTSMVDPSAINDGFEVGFQPTDGKEGDNPYDVPNEILARNRETLNHWASIWLAQSSMLAPFVLDDFGVNRVSGEMTKDANVDVVTCDAERKDTAVICAAGPSLEKYLGALKDYKGIILAAPTVLSTLSANGIKPHYCVAVDANSAIGEILSEAPYTKMGVKLLIPPTTDWKSANAFEGSRYWFKSLILARNGLNHPFNLYMTLFYPWIQNWTFQAGCVTNTMFLLTTLLNARGNHDIRKVFLFGADFGYPEGLSRIISYKFVKPEDTADGKSRWLPQPRDSVEWRAKRIEQARAANGMLTDIGMLGYKRSLYSIWQMQGCSPFLVEPGNSKSAIRHRPCLYSCSEGILFELPHCDGFEVLKTSGDCVSLYTDRDINRTFKDYMRTSGKAEGQIRADLKVPDDPEDSEDFEDDPDDPNDPGDVSG